MRRETLFLILMVVLCSVSFADTVLMEVQITKENVSNSNNITHTMLLNDSYSSLKKTVYTAIIDTIQYTSFKQLEMGDVIQFDIKRFDFNTFKLTTQEHEIRISEASDSKIVLIVFSDPVTVQLLKGQTKNVDIDGDSAFDIILKYNGFDTRDNKPYLEFMKFNNPNIIDYGNAFCNRANANMDFRCVTLDGTEVPYSSFQLDSKAINVSGKTEQEVLIDEVNKRNLARDLNLTAPPKQKETVNLMTGFEELVVIVKPYFEYVKPYWQIIVISIVSIIVIVSIVIYGKKFKKKKEESIDKYMKVE
ncbi:MAG: hypothetical protein WC781_05435 [Candidatus Pacearchaeota archaeon]|jgi:hypothetical protein